jgi:hypothetical protein
VLLLKDNVMAEIDEDLAAALKQARRMPMYFAFVTKGMGQGKLMVFKKPLPASKVAAAKKALGKGMVFRGRCFGEESRLVFELAKKPPATLAKQLKSIISLEAGLTLRVEARMAADLVEEEDEEAGEAPAAEEPPAAEPAAESGSAVGGGATASAGSAPPAVPKPSGDLELKVAVTKRLAALVDRYKQAVAQHNADAAHMEALFASFKHDLSAQDYVQAAKVLDELEPLVGFLSNNS